ncbi:MAG: hypothetical protein HY907_21215 [Deltaproteobacteria bacterium]|nr:hypothetical protein [Deltaproteobacteria bacterium]
MGRAGRGTGWLSAWAIVLVASGCGGRSSLLSGDAPDPDSGGDAWEESTDVPGDGDEDTPPDDGREGDLAGGDADAGADADADGDADGDDAGDVPCLCLDDLDCADLEPCNGAEQCIDCACRPGIPPADGFPCDDGDACTASESCAGGVCGGGEPVCVCEVDDDCLAYDDGDRCNGRPLCVGRACVFDPATVVTCDSSGDTACLVNRCVAVSGECVPMPVADGTACDDGNACTTGEACGGGSCGGGVATCECIVDSDCAAYEDGDSCNGTLRCDLNVCAVDPATVVTCDPSGDSACLANRCAPATGTCAPQPRSEGASCDDGDACTTGDACAAGVCTGPARSCADGNACTDDSCDPATGCLNVPNAAPCDDGNACTVTDVCAAGSCGGVARSCTDGNACTDDTCDPATGCVFPPNTAACDDGSACTVGDVCARGVCTPGAARACDDSNVCTDNACDPVTGCVYPPNTAACDDRNACTTGDRCRDGACASTGSLVCADANLCTDDTCDPAAGCVYPPNAAPCDDGDACTSPDVCSGGVCTGTGLRSWYLDDDGDGYGDALVAVCAAAAPPGYADNPDDCCDTDFRVNPAQTSFFTVGFTCGSIPLLRFDYNCDGRNEQQYTAAGSCAPSGSTCDYVAGWTEDAVPACGASATFLTSCRSMMGSCNEMTGARVQACR